MSSAIEPLLNAIAASPFRVAPEAEEQLASVVADRRVTLEFADELETFAKFVPSRAVVRLGTPFLEVLWASAYSFIVIFDEYEQANKRKDEYFHVGASDRTATAYSLHRLLLEAHTAKVRVPWPLPELVPVRFPDPDTDGHVANELFLTAVSWLIHHEIAHARLDHGELETVESLLQESDADRAATDWVCRDSAEFGPLFKRALGIACANLHLLAYDLQLNRTRWTTHPPTYERLLANLDRIGFEDNHKVYAFGFVILEILLAHHGVGVAVDRTVSFHEMLATACLTVRRLGAA